MRHIEMYPGTEFYGIREILLAYANLPSFLPLPVAVQHGWYRFPTTFEASAKPPEIWVWSQRIATDMEVFYPSRKIRIIGAPFIYLMETLKKDLLLVGKRGSICIPPHSSHLVASHYSVSDFAHRLNGLGDEYKPITVMLYYLDMNDSTVKEYQKFGFNVVSNGSLYEGAFLKNFVRNVHDKKHCIFSDLGSGVLFAGDMGLNLVHFDLESNYLSRGEGYVTDEMISSLENFDRKFLQALNIDLIVSELGKSNPLSPSELRRAIIGNYFTWDFVRTGARRIVGLLRKAFQVRGRMQ